MNQEIKNDMPENNLNLPVRKVCVIVERLINELQGSYGDDSARLELNDLIGKFLNQQVHSGDADDYHDLAAILGSGDEDILACNVLDCGLKYFPQDVDLLADYLLYGPSCNGNKEYYTTQCQKYYEILSKIPKRLWTWRGFSFSINYLFNIKKCLATTDEEVDSLIDESLKIVHEYRKLFPKSEESYRIEAIIYKNSAKYKEKNSFPY